MHLTVIGVNDLLPQLTGPLIRLGGVRRITRVGERIPKCLPDEGVARISLYQPGKVREYLLDEAVMANHMIVSMKSTGKIPMQDIVPGCK